MNFRAVPSKVLKEQEALVNEKKAGGQRKLDGHFAKAVKREYSRDGILHAVGQFITCDNQVSIVPRF